MPPACVDDGDCAAFGYHACCVGGLCVDDACDWHAPCVTDADCTSREEGLVCQDGLCGQPGYCRLDRQCPSGSYCEDTYCRPRPPAEDCVRDADCPPGRMCETRLWSRRCVPLSACGRGRPCPQGESCELGTCVDRGGLCAWIADPPDGCDDGDPTTVDECRPDECCVHLPPTCTAAPTSENPFLGCPDLDCAPTLCDAAGRTPEDILTELDAFRAAHPACTPLPPELACLERIAVVGADWPAQVETAIAAAAAEGGFLDEQVQALRCFAWQQPGTRFSVAAAPGRGTPSQVTLDGFELDIPGGLPEGALDVLGPLIGAVLHVTPNYVFDSPELRPGTDGTQIELRVHTWRDIDYASPPPRPGVRLTLSPLVDGETACSGRYRLLTVESDLDQRIERLDVSGLIAPYDANSAAINACGEDCGMRRGGLPPEPRLSVDPNGIYWDVPLFCDLCHDGTQVDCTYRLDAHTGAILVTPTACDGCCPSGG